MRRTISLLAGCMVTLLGVPLAQAFDCGNGIIEPGETCDDGNVASGDGCSAMCAFEGCLLTGTWQGGPFGPFTFRITESAGGVLSGSYYFTLPNPATPLAGTRTGAAVALPSFSPPLSGTMTDCDTIAAVDGMYGFMFTLSRQSNTVCGDGTLEAGEACDDGNLVNADGCNDLCALPACGNRLVDAGEDCDDGNTVDGDGCSFDCRACGNGTIDSGEECDDGNLVDGDGCSSLCAGQICGDGTVQDPEHCDDGNVVSGDGCSATCTYEGCPVTGTWAGLFGVTWRLIEDGGGTITGIIYSSGPAGSLTGIRNGGAVSFTGFSGGVMTDCDTMVGTMGIFTSATLTRLSDSVCGDGAIDAGEVCDDGNFVDADGCNTLCTPPVCGNQIRDAGEDCDDGNVADGDGCSFDCQACGNGTIDSGEECDDGNLVGGDGCTPGCLVQVCGDGLVQGTEGCDDGNLTSGDGCSATCAFEGCSLTGTWEGGLIGGATWRFLESAGGAVTGAFAYGAASPSLLAGTRSGPTLTLTGDFALTGTQLSCDTLQAASGIFTFPMTRTSAAVCGDGALATAEQCDDGNFVDADACPTTCRLPRCGNGIRDLGEACDDGNAVNGDDCDVNCTPPACGNRVLDPGEQCDDGNLVAGDGCDALCGLPGCPNGVTDPGEQCDDGNLVDGDGCARNCTLSGCGNGILEAGETCDDGNTAACDGCAADCQIETDPDADVVLGACDNCPAEFNPSQRDLDGDGIGDPCDAPLALATSAGTNVLVGDALTGGGAGLTPPPVRDLQVTYATVAGAGLTRVTPLEAPSSALLAANFRVSTLGALLALDSDAAFSGPVTVCLRYDDTGLLPGEEAALRLLHEDGGTFVDATTSVDTVANRLCGQVMHFSRFAPGLAVAGAERIRLDLRSGAGAIGSDAIVRLVGRLPIAAADPAATGLTITLLRDDTVVFERRIPASAWMRTSAGTTYLFVDPSGTLAGGVTRARLNVRDRGTVAVLKLRGSGLDLGGIEPGALTLRLDFGARTVAAPLGCAAARGGRTRCVQ